MNSGLGLDIAKRHSGVAIWDKETDSVETVGFELSEYNSKDYFAEYKMRREFKQRLKELIGGKYFEYCVIEDVYGGENFDTVRKLLALQTVIDELLFEGSVKIEHFYRWKEREWMKNVRSLYKHKGQLKAKIENQLVLGYLGFDFYEKNKDISDAEKAKIFFEDRCDATGMLVSMGSYIMQNKNREAESNIKMSDIKMVYVNFFEEPVRDTRITYEGNISLDLNYSCLERSILDNVMTHPYDVICSYLPPDKLGVFGMKNKFEFYEDNEGYLFYYLKNNKRVG